MNKEYKGLIYSNEEIEKALQQGSSPFMSRSIYDYIMFQFKQLQAYKDKDCRSKTMYINATPPRSGKTYIAKLEQQLQAYKQKEDKLREELLIWGEVINPTLQNKLFEILNEGGK